MHMDVYGDTLCALVSAAALASSGNQVFLHLPDGPAAEKLVKGECPYREPGLADLMAEQSQAGRLVLAGMETRPGQQSRVIWLALSPDAVHLAQDILRSLPSNRAQAWLVVNQSTFPVGTSEALQQVLEEHEAHAESGSAVVSLPDLLTEGNALAGFMRADSWLLGANVAWAEKLVFELLRPFNRRRDTVMVMRPREAEFTKLAITGMLATRLSYMNDMANLADSLDVDIERIRQGMGADKRIGESYLYPGCGFGGLSFSRDVMSLASTLQVSGMQAQLLDEVLRINERQKEVLFRKLWRHYGTELRGRKVAIWGAAFKPESARIDNSPALKLIEALWAQGVEVHVHDPRALRALADWAGEREDLVLHTDPYAAAEGADALMLVTEWKAYWSPDLLRLKMCMAYPLLLDGRNVWDPEFIKQNGFDYFGIGRR
ncbi:UDP-glucose dehydrogenase family protein [Halopseudomonas pelagia]|uniref:UDP-glucose dehydrogenase family protein n=1 Tax=Halopseudomonas pelagia TaxID=553151 RepID=UPI0030DACB10|tara:strand:- start:957 stop:2252 length:1296 start_codon:yes stop_codon:yes gene_type:complete